MRLVGIIFAAFFIWCGAAVVQTRGKIILDTDIGDDIDDAFALGLALSSLELEILGVSGSFGDTPTRARMLDRMLGELGFASIAAS